MELVATVFTLIYRHDSAIHVIKSVNYAMDHLILNVVPARAHIFYMYSHANQIVLKTFMETHQILANNARILVKIVKILLQIAYHVW